MSLGRRRTCQTDPSKGPRPGELIPSLPSIFFFCFSSLVPFLRLSRSPLHLFLLPPQVPLLFSPSSRLSLPPPFLVQAFLGGARRLRVVRVARVPGKPCWAPADRALGREAALRERPPPGPAGPGRTDPAGWASRVRARGSAGREPQRAGSGAAAVAGLL